MVIMLLMSFGTATFAATEKTLYFHKKDGKLYYDTNNTVNLDTFLYFQNMNMNETYEDSLKIKNEADKSYDLYFQILPKEGMSESSLKLLKALEMKIYKDGVLLYQGSADGITKTAGELDVKQMAKIGDFASGQEATLKVEIKLNADETMETQGRYYVKSLYDQWKAAHYDKTKEPTSYVTQKEAAAAAKNNRESEITYHEEAVYKDETIQDIQGMMANTTWKFYGGNQDEIIPINPPNTSDDSMNIVSLVIIAVASLGIIICLGKRKEKHNLK